MEFSDINWLAIAIATLANMLLAYLFFESSLLAKWTDNLGKELHGGRSKFEKFSAYLGYSFLLAILIWSHAGSFLGLGFWTLANVAGLLLFALDVFAPLDYRGRQYRVRMVFLMVSAYISLAVTAFYVM